MHYITANQIHNGFDFLPSETVLVIDDIGTIIDITLKSNVTQHRITYHEGIICPGFVNAHCHLELSHLKSVIPKHTGLISFLKQIISHRNICSEKDKQTIITAAIASMKQNGIVAVGDIANTADLIPNRLKNDLHYYTFIESIGFDPDKADKTYEQARHLLREYALQNTEKKTYQSIVPHAPYSVAPELFHKIAQQGNDVVISIHNEECVAENEYFKHKTGEIRDLFNFLKINDNYFSPTNTTSLQTYLPYFNINQSLILVHNTQIQLDDIELITQYPNLYLCLCPNANLYIENILPPINTLKNSGLNICLGTDSLASNDILSIWSEVQTILLYFPTIPITTLLKWATINGAKALKMDHLIGSFEIGKTPGINLINAHKQIEVLY